MKMNNQKINASLASDQPQHEKLKPVELAGMELWATVHYQNAENAELRISEVKIRDAKMDDYGVGYGFEIAQGKSWKKAVLSRRNFGIDNFSLDMKTTQYVNVREEGSEMIGSNIQVSARLWHWKGDEELAKKALLDAMAVAIKSQVGAFNVLTAKADAERLDPLPMPAPVAASTTKSRARP